MRTEIVLSSNSHRSAPICVYGLRRAPGIALDEHDDVLMGLPKFARAFELAADPDRQAANSRDQDRLVVVLQPGIQRRTDRVADEVTIHPALVPEVTDNEAGEPIGFQ